MVTEVGALRSLMLLTPCSGKTIISEELNTLDNVIDNVIFVSTVSSIPC